MSTLDGSLLSPTLSRAESTNRLATSGRSSKKTATRTSSPGVLVNSNRNTAIACNSSNLSSNAPRFTPTQFAYSSSSIVAHRFAPASFYSPSPFYGNASGQSSIVPPPPPPPIFSPSIFSPPHAFALPLHQSAMSSFAHYQSQQSANQIDRCTSPTARDTLDKLLPLSRLAIRAKGAPLIRAGNAFSFPLDTNWRDTRSLNAECASRKMVQCANLQQQAAHHAAHHAWNIFNGGRQRYHSEASSLDSEASADISIQSARSKNRFGPKNDNCKKSISITPGVCSISDSGGSSSGDSTGDTMEIQTTSPAENTSTSNIILNGSTNKSRKRRKREKRARQWISGQAPDQLRVLCQSGHSLDSCHSAHTLQSPYSSLLLTPPMSPLSPHADCAACHFEAGAMAQHCECFVVLLDFLLIMIS